MSFFFFQKIFEACFLLQNYVWANLRDTAIYLDQCLQMLYLVIYLGSIQLVQ